MDFADRKHNQRDDFSQRYVVSFRSPFFIGISDVFCAGALVTSSDTGITFFFPPFSTEETSQSEARIILENNPFIRGMATDSAASLAVSALLAVLVLLACVA